MNNRPDMLTRVRRTYELAPTLRKTRVDIAKLKKVALRGVQQAELPPSQAVGVILPQTYKEVTITIPSPTNSEDDLVRIFGNAVTILSVWAVIKGATSATINPVWGLDRSAAGTALLANPTVIDNTTTGQQITSFASAAIPAGGILRLKTTALSGTPTELSVTFRYTDA